MEKLEKILELLEKSSDVGLTAEEEITLKTLTESDAESGDFAELYNSLKKHLPASFHPDEELLASYIMLENGEESENRILPLLSDKIKQHIVNCSECRAIYDTIKKEYDDVNEYVTKRFLNSDPDNILKPKANVFSLFKSYSGFRYAFAAVLLIGFVYLGLYTASTISTPEYVQQFSNDEDEFYVTRGRTSLLFQKGLDAIENKKWDEAVNYLNEDIMNHESEGSIFYSHYVLGLTYLKYSSSDFLGLFKSFDKEKVQLAINSLSKSIEKNKSGNYENVNLDAHYYLGTAYMLLDDFNSAEKHLQVVVNDRGRFYKDAQRLINSITDKTSEKN